MHHSDVAGDVGDGELCIAEVVYHRTATSTVVASLLTPLCERRTRPIPTAGACGRGMLLVRFTAISPHDHGRVVVDASDEEDVWEAAAGRQHRNAIHRPCRGQHSDVFEYGH